MPSEVQGKSMFGHYELPKGIAVLLYGEPGTGKTESVMQIARATLSNILPICSEEKISKYSRKKIGFEL